MTKPFETAIAVRAYSERPPRRRRRTAARRLRNEGVLASPWTLIFDCETTIDAAQRLKLGFYQVRDGERLAEEGVFFDADANTKKELGVLERYAAARGIRSITADDFRKLFLRYGYRLHGTIVGLNLPFDLSRIAVRHSPARGHMRGGFSFELTNNRYDPRVRVKHLSATAALIDFATPAEQLAVRSARKDGKQPARDQGRFVDVKTLAAALLSLGRGGSLQRIAATLKTKTQKLDVDEHGRVTPEYLDYARSDTRATWECYRELSKKYAEHGLVRPIDSILSEASLGKAYLQAMAVRTMRECMPDFPRKLLGHIMCAYYGGRAEVRMRRVVCEVLYCDFKSMYPTVNGLMGLWDHLTSDGITYKDATAATQRFLREVTLADLQHGETWRRLPTLVQLRPNDDLFPVRAPYDSESRTIGLNYLTAPKLWYTLADCVVSKLVTGKTPAILSALSFHPGKPQEGLTPVCIQGRADYRVDPYTQDFFIQLIDLRDEAKRSNDPSQLMFKILANSTSYGIPIEVDRDEAPKSELLHVYGPNGELLRRRTRSVEQPGTYFHPLLGVLVTGAARLMLAIAEKLTMDEGLDWAFCDTDSIAIVRPDSIARREFNRRTKRIIDWFVPLNPYEAPGSILKRESHNDSIDQSGAEPLYCFAISAKRYALFNQTHQGAIVLRKASAHGLGHLLDPYGEQDAPQHLPTPRVALRDIGVHRWQHDFWVKIIQAAINGHPDHVSLDWHPSFNHPATMRYNATSPQMLKWVDSWNEGKPYQQQIRPFGFLNSYTARSPRPKHDIDTVSDRPKRGRPKEVRTPKPISPFDKSQAKGLSQVFDRVTGDPVKPSELETYAESLRQYHLSPESKFENGGRADRGRTERRHVVATRIVWIGKEANRVGESGDASPIESAVQEFTAMTLDQGKSASNG